MLVFLKVRACVPCDDFRLTLLLRICFSAVSNLSCSPCPRDTYRDTEGAISVSQCQVCHTAAYTQGRGKSNPRDCICSQRHYWALSGDVATCYVCPAGAVCTDGTCFLSTNEDNCTFNGKRVGTWVRDMPGFGVYRVQSCPEGYTLVNSTDGTSRGIFSHDSQQCKQCLKDREYVINPNTDACQPCPLGLVCDGTSTATPVVPGSVWEAEDGVYRLRSCPSGYSLSATSDVFQVRASCSLSCFLSDNHAHNF